MQRINYDTIRTHKRNRIYLLRVWMEDKQDKTV